MGLKGFRLISFFTTAMGLLVAAIAIVQAFARLASSSSRPPMSDALVPVSLAFVAIGMLSGAAYTAFKAQAEQIATLERKLAGR